MEASTTMLTVAEYAKLHNIAPRTIRQKAQAERIPGAVKFGRDWAIPSDAPYVDSRIKSGEYKGWRKKYGKPSEGQRV